MTVDELDSVVPFTRGRWGRRPRAWRRWLIAIGLAAIVCLVGWVVFFSSLLGVRTVEVEGAHTISSQQITAAAKIAPGTPLARVNLDAVKARVEAIPAVASVTVNRGWPHTIVISLTERQPVAVIHQNGAWWVMDKTGVLFAKAGARSPGEPIVEIDGSPSPQTLPQVASVLGSLPPGLRTSTHRITASSIDSIALVLNDGSTVKWGSASNSVQKAEVLNALLTRKAKVYDVSIPSQPAIMR